MDCTAIARELKLHGAGQDMLSDAFYGNAKGMGPGSSEMEFEKRGSAPILIFMADKTLSCAWNMPLYKTFADPFNTIGLVISERMILCSSFVLRDRSRLSAKCLNRSSFHSRFKDG
jgi:fructose 1,6-bisphosphate aldolase/phosphatase